MTNEVGTKTLSYEVGFIMSLDQSRLKAPLLGILSSTLDNYDTEEEELTVTEKAETVNVLPTEGFYEELNEAKTLHA